MIVVSPFLCFAGIGWWQHVAAARGLLLDGHEHFEKMTERNRYRISGANNSILLTVPILNGRDQKVLMKDARIDNTGRWQVQHWRTLVSVYNRSPYFTHYGPSLSRLYTTQFASLTDFNRASMLWVMQQLRLSIDMHDTAAYIKTHEGCLDLRPRGSYIASAPQYHQVFIDRLGFLPGLSILDLLFSEGPGAVKWLR